jgi:hypothetical protein
MTKKKIEDSDNESQESNETQESEEEIKSPSNNKDDEENSKASSRDVDPNSSFYSTFIDGSSLRYLIEYLRLISLEGVFIFHKNLITYQKGDDDGNIFNDIKIKTYELTDYEFSSSNPEISANINLAEFRNKTRTVGKKEQLDIYKRPNEPTNFYIQVRSQGKGANDAATLYCMPMRSENITIYELPTYTRNKHNPNITIYQTDFTKLCKALVANKCNYADFIGYDKGILIKGYTSDGKIALVQEYGKLRTTTTKTSTTKSIITVSDTIKPQVAAPKLNIRDAEEIERFKIPNTTIKALSKLTGFSPNGTIKFYIEKDKPMKLVTSIGNYGKLRILIRSV